MRRVMLGVALWAVLGGVARGDDGGARAHFLSGLQLYGQARFAAALDEFRAAWVTWHDPELLLDMAECNRHLGNLDEAREQYRGFLARAPHSPLRGSVERQLARLDAGAFDAPPPVELATPLVPPSAREPSQTHRGRAAKIVGVTAWSASLVSLAVGIYGYATYHGLESTTHNDLQAMTPARPLTIGEQTFFNNPSCSVPSSLAGSPAAAQYSRDCNRGSQWAGATTGLWVASAAFAAAGTVSWIVGVRQADRARERPLTIAPVVGPTIAGLHLRYTF